MGDDEPHGKSVPNDTTPGETAPRDTDPREAVHSEGAQGESGDGERDRSMTAASGAGVMWSERNDVFRPQVLPVERILKRMTLDDPVVIDDSPIVLIRRDVMADLLRDTKKDVRREHGGIFLGDVYEDIGGRFLLIITVSILAEKTEGSPAHLQFSQDSWQVIWNRMKDHEHKIIVGWYHTHPGLGVFLSGTDLRTQATYFSQPWHIAVVVDPIREDIGFFWGARGEKLRTVRTFTTKDEADAV